MMEKPSLFIVINDWFCDFMNEEEYANRADGVNRTIAKYEEIYVDSDEKDDIRLIRVYEV